MGVDFDPEATDITGDLELQALAEDYPRWRVWRGAGNGIVYAWMLKTSPPVVLRDHSPAGLRLRVVEFMRVYEARRSLAEALAAAEHLET